MHDAAANAAAGQGDREDAAPVVAAGAGVEPRRAAEFGQADDERFVQEAALLQVRHERRKRRVRRRHEHFLQPLRFVGVRIPAGIVRRLVGPAEPVHLHQPHARFDQASAEEARLAELRHAVLLPQLFGLLGQVEGTPGFGAESRLNARWVRPS